MLHIVIEWLKSKCWFEIDIAYFDNVNFQFFKICYQSFHILEESIYLLIETYDLHQNIYSCLTLTLTLSKLVRIVKLGNIFKNILKDFL